MNMEYVEEKNVHHIHAVKRGSWDVSPTHDPKIYPSANPETRIPKDDCKNVIMSEFIM
jgi:hypothetical protein